MDDEAAENMSPTTDGDDHSSLKFIDHSPSPPFRPDPQPPPEPQASYAHQWDDREPTPQRRCTFGATAFLKQREKDREEDAAARKRKMSWKSGLRPKEDPPGTKPEWALSPARRVVFHDNPSHRGRGTEHSEVSIGHTRAFGDALPLPACKPLYVDGRSREDVHKDLLRLRSVDAGRAEEAKQRLERHSTPQRVREGEWRLGAAKAPAPIPSTPALESYRRELRDKAPGRWKDLRQIDQHRHEGNSERKARLESPLKQRETGFNCAPLNPKKPFPALLDVSELRGRKEFKVGAKYTQWEQEQRQRLAQRREEERKEKEEAAAQAAMQNTSIASRGSSPSRRSRRGSTTAPEPTGSPVRPRSRSLGGPAARRAAPRVRRSTPRSSSTGLSRCSTTSAADEVLRLRRENETLRAYVEKLEGCPAEYLDDPSLPPSEREIRRRLRDAFILGRSGASDLTPPRALAAGARGAPTPQQSLQGLSPASSSCGQGQRASASHVDAASGHLFAHSPQGVSAAEYIPLPAERRRPPSPAG